MIDRLDVERCLVRLVAVVELERKRVGRPVLVHRLPDVALNLGELLLHLSNLSGGHVRRGTGRGHDGTAVGGFDHHLEVRRRAGARHILQGEAVDVALVGDEVQIGADSLLGRVDETEVADHIHDPEVLVAGRRLHDLLGRRDHDQGRVLELGVDWHDVLGVVLDGAGGLARYGGLLRGGFGWLRIGGG